MKNNDITQLIHNAIRNYIIIKMPSSGHLNISRKGHQRWPGACETIKIAVASDYWCRLGSDIWMNWLHSLHMVSNVQWRTTIVHHWIMIHNAIQKYIIIKMHVLRIYPSLSLTDWRTKLDWGVIDCFASMTHRLRGLIINAAKQNLLEEYKQIFTESSVCVIEVSPLVLVCLYYWCLYF